MREIRFYRTESGYCPVEEFLDSLSAKQAQKTIWVLQLIEDMDIVPVQYFKKLANTDDIWEVESKWEVTYSESSVFSMVSTWLS